MKVRIFILAAVIAIALIGLVIYFTKKDTKYSWMRSYRANDENPYGLTILYELLKRSFHDKEISLLKKPVAQSLIYEKNKVYNYLFIGESYFLDEAGKDKLVEFVRNGNSAFIISSFLPDNLKDQIGLHECSGEEEFYFSVDDKNDFNFFHPALKAEKDYRFNYRIRDKVVNYNWHYFPQGDFCNSVLGPLGYSTSDRVNFARLKVGDGYFYFHTNPIAFANIHLIREEGFEYATRTFSHMMEGDIFWDEFSRVPARSTDNSGNESPLSYILSQQPLAWGWYLALLLLVLYILFFSKRKQRVIPVLESNNNTSIEFTETIGRLYYQQNKHLNLSRQKMKLFLAFIRTRYNLHTTEIDDKFISQLSLKSQVPENEIQAIFKEEKRIIFVHDVDNDTLIRFHNLIENFYNKCK
jgi:hypothetical protein